jgi:hypothetical protein
MNTKSIQLQAEFVAATAIQGIKNIVFSRKSEADKLIQDWVESENKWRSRLSFMRCPLVEAKDFKPEALPVHQSFYYHMVRNQLHHESEEILNCLIKTANLSISHGDGAIWLDSEEAATLQNWKDKEVAA